jgi:5-formyltetrahydrofolate cyclo-ligase
MWDICPTFFFAMNTDILKKELRKEIRKHKNALSNEHRLEKSDNVLSLLESHPRFQEAGRIMFFWSMDDEVHTHDFIQKWAEKKDFILPVVEGSNLRWKRFTGIEEMEAGENFGIPEPLGEDFTEMDSVDLILVPGVAFDRNLNRMGRGKAYYDKTLKNLKAYKIGICFDFQMLDHVPTDKHDVRMNEIIND